MIRRPPRSTLFPYTSSSDLTQNKAARPHRCHQARSRAADVLSKGYVSRSAEAEVLLGPLLCQAYLATDRTDRKSTRLNSSHSQISYAVFCLKNKQSTNCSDL